MVSLISIHSLYAEGDIPIIILLWLCINFNPLPLRRGRLGDWEYRWDSIKISIHSLYAEGDKCLGLFTLCLEEFQSTPSTQRETQAGI